MTRSLAGCNAILLVCSVRRQLHQQRAKGRVHAQSKDNGIGKLVPAPPLSLTPKHSHESDPYDSSNTASDCSRSPSAVLGRKHMGSHHMHTLAVLHHYIYMYSYYNTTYIVLKVTSYSYYI